ncbi:MAG: hypothetical protein SF339_02450 [Blastocatellia bacterium]|nr:hypothetical protein [Blastocatellia bacterium]
MITRTLTSKLATDAASEHVPALAPKIVVAARIRKQAQELLTARQSPEKWLCNLDGKTLRGTIAAEETKGTHLSVIQQAGANLVLAQAPVGEKKNETSAAPDLTFIYTFLNKPSSFICKSQMVLIC